MTHKPSCPQSIGIGSIPRNQDHGPIGWHSHLDLTSDGSEDKASHEWIGGEPNENSPKSGKRKWKQPQIVCKSKVLHSYWTIWAHGCQVFRACQPSSPRVKGKWAQRASSAGRRHQSNSWSWLGFAEFKKRAYAPKLTWQVEWSPTQNKTYRWSIGQWGVIMPTSKELNLKKNWNHLTCPLVGWVISPFLCRWIQHHVLKPPPSHRFDVHQESAQLHHVRGSFVFAGRRAAGVIANPRLAPGDQNTFHAVAAAHVAGGITWAMFKT